MKAAFLAFASAAALAAALAAPVTSHAQSVAPDAAAVSRAPFSSNDLLWLEVRSGGALLAESMDAYASRSGVYVPIGQFARVLDLAIAVVPEQRRAEGWVLKRERTFELDLETGEAHLAGVALKISPGQAVAFGDDIYVRLDLLEKLLPIRARADVSAQLLALQPLEPLPFQQRVERQSRRRDLDQEGGPAGPEGRVITAPYALFSAPSFDVNFGGQMARDGVDQARRFDIRAAGDLAYAGFQGYLGSDDRGRVDDVRVLFERRDSDGHALSDLGAFSAIGATRVGVGDVFSPSTALGAASFGGRGVFYSSAALETLDLSTPLSLRGELAVGEEVELYVNETLRGSQASPINGRYEFLNVPLSVGLNTLRLVFYGSQGQKREETKRINVGAGQVRPGQLTVQFAAIQQGRTVIDLDGSATARPSGAPRMVLLADYGIGPAFSLNGSLARFTPRGMTTRMAATGGVRASLAGAAVQVDLAGDDHGGTAASLAVAARPRGIALIGRRSQYAGGFVDEARQVFLSDDSRLSAASELSASTNLVLAERIILPVSLDLRQVERVDHSRRLTLEGRSSAAIGRYYLSASIFQDRETSPTWARTTTGGRLDVATLATRDIQFRSGVSYKLGDDLGVESAYASMDWRLKHGDSLHLGAVRTIGALGETSLQGSYLIRARSFDLAANASYDTGSNNWRLGVQIGFALAFDPLAGRYRLARPGVSATGAAALRAFVDQNGDGRRQAHEAPVAGVRFGTPSGAVVTDDQGRAFADGLVDGAPVRVRVDTDELDDPYLGHVVPVVTLAPRIGRTLVIDYPLRRSSEVEFTVKLQGATGAPRPLSAVNLVLEPVSGGASHVARTDHAGVGFFDGVPGGEYALRLDVQQAESLGMVLANPIVIVAPDKGGYVAGGEAVVRFARETRP